MPHKIDLQPKLFWISFTDVHDNYTFVETTFRELNMFEIKLKKL